MRGASAFLEVSGDGMSLKEGEFVQTTSCLDDDKCAITYVSFPSLVIIFLLSSKFEIISHCRDSIELRPDNIVDECL